MGLGHPWILVPLAGSLKPTSPADTKGPLCIFLAGVWVKRISLSLMNFIEVSLASLPNERTLPLTV